MKWVNKRYLLDPIKACLIVSIFFCVNGIAKAHGPDDNGSQTDLEQKQLEWCFIYSNIFGYDVSYIANPRLYDNVSQWMGTPYKYAGHSKKGIDCSGFVCRLLQDSYNLDVQGSSRDLHKRTTNIKKKDLREGDLVFFKIRKGRISHVGLYLGKNKFAHASSSSGVIISDLDDPYYEKYYYSAGRLIN